MIEISTVAELLIKIGADSKQFDKAIGRTKKSLNKMSKKLTSIGKGMSAGFTAPLVGSFIAATKGTEEFRGDLAKLETNAEGAGVGADKIREALVRLSGVSDETDSNVEALSNLLATGFDEQGMTAAMDALSGAAIKFPDTMKLEGMADGLQETLATGKAIGPFAELLDRLGISTEKFDEGLKKASEAGREQEYVLETLAKTGLADVNEAYRKNNKELVKSKESSTEFMLSMAELGDTLTPIVTKVTGAITKLVDKFNALSPSAQQLIIKTAGIVAAVGPLLIGLGMLVTAIKATLLPLASMIIKITAATYKWLFLGTTTKRSALQVAKSWALIAASGIKNAAIHVAQAGVVVAKWVWMGVQSLAQAARMAAAWIIAMGPIAWVIAAVVGLVVLIIANWDKIKTKTIEIFKSISKWLGDTFNNLKTTAITWGKNLIKGFWNGIKDMGAWIKSKVTGFVEGISSTIKDFFGISSPSRMMGEYGGNIVEGLAVGIEKNAYKVNQAMEKMMQSTVSELDRLGDAVISALKSRYSAEEKLQLDSLRKQTDNLSSEMDKRMKAYDRELAAKLRILDDGTNEELSALQDQIDGISKRTKEEEKQLEAQAFAKRLTDKQKKLSEAETAEARKKIQSELNAILAERERSLLLESRQNQINALRAEMDGIKTQAESKKIALEAEFEEKKKHEELILQEKNKALDAESQAIQQHYAELNTAEALQAEARRLAIDKNNGEMITLLNSYNPNWQNAGQSFGDSLINGLNSRKASIEAVIADIMSMVGGVGGFSTSAIQEQMEANSAKWLKVTDPKIREQLHQKNIDLAKQIPGATFDSGVWDIPGLATGTNNVPQDMFAMLHEGEGVVPKKYNNNQGNGGPVTIIVELDGRQIAKGSAPHIVDLIRIKTGLRI